MLLGIIAILVVFFLLYDACYTQRESEACAGIIFASATFGGPWTLFLIDSFYIDIGSFLFGQSAWHIRNFADVIMYVVVSNFVIGAYIGWVYGLIKNGGIKGAIKKIIYSVVAIALVAGIIAFFYPRTIFTGRYYSAFSEPQYRCFGITVKGTYPNGIVCYGIRYITNEKTVSEYTDDKLGITFKYPSGWQVLQTIENGYEYDGVVLVPPISFGTRNGIYISRTDCNSVWQRYRENGWSCSDVGSVSVYHYKSLDEGARWESRSIGESISKLKY